MTGQPGKEQGIRSEETCLTEFVGCFRHRLPYFYTQSFAVLSNKKVFFQHITGADKIENKYIHQCLAIVVGFFILLLNRYYARKCCS